MAESVDDDLGGNAHFESPAGSYFASLARGVSPLKVLAAGPRASQFLLRSATRNLRFPAQRTRPEIPTRIPSWGTAAGVWADELILAFMATTRLHGTEAEYDRIAAEVDLAIDALESAGALADPRVVHREPDATPAVRVTPGSYRGLRFSRVTFDSDYEPAVELPGTSRWQSVAPNQTVHVNVLRHREPRPWVIQLHGFGMGHDSDLAALRARHMFMDLGLNVAQPVFPMHGPRSGGPDGEEALTMDYLNNVHAVSQAVWDVRRLIAWIRTLDGDTDRVAVHGVSMGGYLAAMLAGLEPAIGCVISGVPTVDLAWVMGRHLPEADRTLADERRLLGRPAEVIHSVVSPLSLEPLVPHDRRFVYAGVADRMATPGQAYRLWEHWGGPSVLWYRGAHVSFTWSREVRTFVDHALKTSGFVHRTSTR